MRALILVKHNQFELQDVPEPSLEPDDVLVQVRACGICGSDVHGINGSTGRRRPPIIMGHEASGVITRLGARATGWTVGDRVTFDSTIYCGQCRFCRAGETNLCDDRRVLGVSCDEYRQHGAFAQFVAVPQHILYPLPDELSFEQAALIEPTSIAVHAVNRTPIRLGDTAVVVGAGMIGLLCVQALRTAGCAKIIAVDLDSRRLEIARQLGADHVVRSEGDATLGRVFELTDGRGADVAVEAVGIAATVQLGVECLRKGGHLSLIGNLASTVELPLQAVVTRELTLYGSCASRGDYPSCLDLIARGAIRVDPLISARAPLAEGPSWFTRLRDGSEGLMKVVLEPQNS